MYLLMFKNFTADMHLYLSLFTERIFTKLPVFRNSVQETLCLGTMDRILWFMSLIKYIEKLIKKNLWLENVQNELK